MVSLLTLLVALVADQFAAAPFLVQVQPLIRDQLGGVAWTTLKAECNAIWLREGVAIQWDGNLDVWRTPDLLLPTVFDEWELQQHDRTQTAIGSTLFAGRNRKILISVSRARELAVAVRAPHADALERDVAVGRLLGRVLAHEIGHVLLSTTGHAERGLMRQFLDAGEASAPSDENFQLSESDRARLALRFPLRIARPGRLQADIQGP